RGGATDPYFTKKYRDGEAISGLIDVANKKGAKIPFSTDDVPSLKKGDAILVYSRNSPGSEHVLMLTEDYSGGANGEVDAIQGGQVDPGNPDYSTAINRVRFKFS